MVSNRGPQFASRFWKLVLLPQDRTAPLGGLASETDGQTERMNAIMEQHLRAYISYLQDDWTDYLFLAKSDANNQVSDTTSVFPFFANYGYHPKYDFELDHRVDSSEEQQAQTAAKRLATIHDVARSEMRYAQVRYQDNADNHRTPAPAVQPGDMVWIDGRHWRTETKPEAGK